MTSVDADRLKVWQALSWLFLDTEVDERDFAYIARVVRQTGYSAEQTRIILWNEVYPVLGSNLRSVAGEWAGWSDEWLMENLQPSQGPAKSRWGWVAKEIRRCWEQVEQQLAADQNP